MENQRQLQAEKKTPDKSEQKKRSKPVDKDLTSASKNLQRYAQSQVIGKRQMWIAEPPKKEQQRQKKNLKGRQKTAEKKL